MTPQDPGQMRWGGKRQAEVLVEVDRQVLRTARMHLARASRQWSSYQNAMHLVNLDQRDAVGVALDLIDQILDQT